MRPHLSHKLILPFLLSVLLTNAIPLTVDRRAPSELTDIVELKWLYLNGEMIWHARRTAGLGKTRIALNAVKDEKPEINTDPNIKLYSIPAGWPGHIAAFAMTKIGGEEMADEVKDLESKELFIIYGQDGNTTDSRWWVVRRKEKESGQASTI